MKKLGTLILILLWTLSQSSFAQETIPNGDFEESEGNFISGWDLTSGQAQVREFLTLNGSSGSYTVEPQSGDKFVTLMNGSGSLGVLKAIFPISSRPEAFEFYTGYLCQIAGEKFAFGIIFTKENQGTGMKDTVLYAVGKLPQGSGQIFPWARVSGSLDSYYKSSEMPDEATIIFITDAAVSSTGNIIASPSTVLILDNVQFTSASTSRGSDIQMTNLIDVGNYPNPVMTTSTIVYELLNNSLVDIKIYDVEGRLIETILHKNQGRGKHLLDFDVSHLQRGIYIYKVSTDFYTKTAKMIVR